MPFCIFRCFGPRRLQSFPCQLREGVQFQPDWPAGVVLSNNDACVVARSNEAKALEIGMGVPEFVMGDTIRAHRVQVFSSNYALYGDMSQRVMETLQHFCPDLEIYSIDEAFLSLSGFKTRNFAEYAATIRSRVKRWTGLPVSIDIERAPGSSWWLLIPSTNASAPALFSTHRAASARNGKRPLTAVPLPSPPAGMNSRLPDNPSLRY
jgi:hypothetical protein